MLKMSRQQDQELRSAELGYLLKVQQNMSQHVYKQIIIINTMQFNKSHHNETTNHVISSCDLPQPLMRDLLPN